MAKSWRDMNERERMNRRLGALKLERSAFDPVYQALSRQLAPANGRFFEQMPNRAVRDYSHIKDSTGPEAVNTSAAGLMSIASNPAQPWLRYTTRDPDLDDYQPVQSWLADAAHITLDVMANNGTYAVLPHYYRELLVFATSAGLLLPHFRKVMCHYPMTCGEYWLQQDDEGEINTFAREFHMTVAQMKKRFGLENCSKAVQSDFKEGHLDAHHHIAHLIEPREDRDPGKLDGRNMPWRSVYWEVGHDSEQLLDDTGFEDFPVLATRGDVVGRDTYGTWVGNLALKHCERLQVVTTHLGKGEHQLLDPATVWPVSAKNKEVNTNPGGRSYVDLPSNSAGARAVHDMKPDTRAVQERILHMQGQIRRALFSEFFTAVLSLSAGRTQPPTAEEVRAVKDEGFLQLGPFGQHLFGGLLSPMASAHFKTLLKNGAFEPPPPELYGREISVRMISVLAQAQEAIGANADDRFVFQCGQIAAWKPDVAYSFNAAKWAERYVKKTGADPDMLVPSEQVEKVLAARDQAMAAKEQAEMLPNYTKSAKDVAEVQQLSGAGAGA